MAFKKGDPKPPGSGRKKGVTNATTKALKEMILGALDRAGGEDYLLQQAKAEPKAFLALLGRVLPTTLEGGEDGQGLTIVKKVYHFGQKENP